MDGMFLFNRSGELERAFIHSDSLTNAQKNEAVHSEANSHSEWTDSQAIEALKQAGATYGPWNKNGFLKSLPVVGLQDAFGGKVTVESGNFETLSATREGDFAIFHWTVGFRVQGHAQKAIEYKAIFEPFGGRLTWLGRIEQLAP
jgi:hypothetical protein